MAEYSTSNRRTSRKSTVSQEENYATHLQPQAPELEKAVLGSILVEQNALSEVAEILKSDSFYDPRHQTIYNAALSLSMADKPVDILTVIEHLRANGELNNVGGPAYITQLANIVSGSANIQYYSAIIEQKALARKLITFSSKVQTNAFDETTDIKVLMDETEAELFKIAQTNSKKDYTQIHPVLDEAMRMVKDAAKRDGLSGVSSGFTKLDQITSGWQNSDLVIIAARPAMGKTAFALSMAKNIAVDQKIPMALFSLEMSNVQLINRVITNVCSIKSEKLRTGKLLPPEWSKLDSGYEQMKDSPLYLDDTPGLSIYELRTKARRLVREHGVKIIMIDYLQLMTASDGNVRFGNRQEEVSTISRTLKGLAKELQIPIIALSQLNRGVDQRISTTQNGEVEDSKRPQLSDLRESGAIEQDADIVCFIHRPEYYKIYKGTKGEDLHGKGYIIVAKHRNGKCDDVLLGFRGEFTRFYNLEDEENASADSTLDNGETYSSMINSVDIGDDPLPPTDQFGEITGTFDDLRGGEIAPF